MIGKARHCDAASHGMIRFVESRPAHIDSTKQGLAEDRTALEQALMTFYKPAMIAYMRAHPDAYEEAVALAIADKQPYSWRAAWLLCDCIDEDDPRIRRHVKRIIRAIEGKEDGHQRELLKILHRMKLSARDEGLAFDACVGLWEKIDAQPSVRVNALKLLVSIARRYPELVRELRFLTQERYLASCSLPVRRSIARMLKGLD